MTTARAAEPGILRILRRNRRLIDVALRAAFLVVLVIFTILRPIPADDAHAYWAVDVADPYTRPVATFDAFTYTPPAALFFGFLGNLPFEVFEAGWTLLIGLALSGTTFGVVMGVVAKVVAPDKRSVALGIVGAGGSFGQFAMVPYGQGLISGFGWFPALLTLAVTAALIVPLAAGLSGRVTAAAHGAHQSAGEAFGEAFGQKSFHFLFWSYFVCGVHTAFMALHLPSYVQDAGLPLTVGMAALALIGFGNIFGSYGAGWLGGRTSKKWLLTWIYGLRAVMILILMLAPKTATTMYLFAFGMGLLWLSTVPLTQALVAQIFGTRHVSMLAGVVFFGHQIGSFCGAWLGGVIFTRQGSYDLAWWISMGLAILAAIACAPINERPLARPASAAA
jgi:predicted MFS family arabinose efflux permease